MYRYAPLRVTLKDGTVHELKGFGLAACVAFEREHPGSNVNETLSVGAMSYLIWKQLVHEDKYTGTLEEFQLQELDTEVILPAKGEAADETTAGDDEGKALDDTSLSSSPEPASDLSS
jgi:hypothetical protein